MDLTNRKAAGEHVDSKNIKKHKNDVFRLTELIDPTVKITAPQGVYTDVQEFVQRMQSESIDMKQLGLIGRTKYINELGSRESDNCNDIQATIGVGVGFDWVHEGNTYTFLKYTKKDGTAIPKSEQHWYKQIRNTANELIEVIANLPWWW